MAVLAEQLPARDHTQRPGRLGRPARHHQLGPRPGSTATLRATTPRTLMCNPGPARQHRRASRPNRTLNPSTRQRVGHRRRPRHPPVPCRAGWCHQGRPKRLTEPTNQRLSSIHAPMGHSCGRPPGNLSAGRIGTAGPRKRTFTKTVARIPRGSRGAPWRRPPSNFPTEVKQGFARLFAECAGHEATESVPWSSGVVDRSQSAVRIRERAGRLTFPRGIRLASHPPFAAARSAGDACK